MVKRTSRKETAEREKTAAEKSINGKRRENYDQGVRAEGYHRTAGNRRRNNTTLPPLRAGHNTEEIRTGSGGGEKEDRGEKAARRGETVKLRRGTERGRTVGCWGGFCELPCNLTIQRGRGMIMSVG